MSWKKIACVFLAAFVLTIPVWAKDFSADLVSNMAGGSMNGRIFMTKGKMRMETPQSVTITRMDKKIIWVLMPTQKMYMEQAVNPDKTKGLSKKVEGEIDRQKIGKENVNGYAADKYKITYTNKGNKESIFQWVSPDIDMPVKTSDIAGKWSMELKNIKIGPVPGSLFEVPKGYSKFSYKMPSF